MPTKLKLKSLRFLSSVDFPAQEPATCVLTKRAGHEDVLKATCRVTKLDESLGLVVGMSIVTSIDGVPYTDLQGDQVAEGDGSLLKAIIDFAEAGGPTDVQHDGAQDGRLVMSWLFDQEFNDAMEVKSRKYGWATGLRVSPETFAAFKSGALSGFSIEGLGERTPVEKSAIAKQAALTTETDGHQHMIASIDDAGGGSTSYETSSTGIGHAHPWIENEDGSISIGASAGHTHELAVPAPGPNAEDLLGAGPDTAAAKHLAERKAEIEKAAAAVAKAAALEKLEAAQMTSFLDGILKASGLSIARKNAEMRAGFKDATTTAEGAAAKAWLEAHPAIEEVEKSAPPTFEQLMKANETAFQKADRDLNGYIAKCAAEWKVDNARATVRLFNGAGADHAAHKEFAKLYDAQARAKKAFYFGDVEALRGPLLKQRDEKYAAMEAMVEAHQLQHNVDDVHKARAFLGKTSSAYKQLEADYQALDREQRMAPDAIAQQTAAYHEAEAKKRDTAEAVEAEKRRIAKMKPGERAMTAHVEKLAKARGETFERAMGWAMQHDPTAQALYQVYTDERTGAQGGN